jgi:hypothetical protein
MMKERGRDKAREKGADREKDGRRADEGTGGE